MKVDFNVVYPYQKMTKTYWISSRRMTTAEERNCLSVHVVLPLVMVYWSSMIEKPVMLYEELRLTVVS